MNKRRNQGSAAGVRFTAALAAICVVALIVGGLLDRAGLASLNAGNDGTASALRMSEIQNHNVLTLRDEYGEAPAWVELENTGDQPISLRGVCLVRDTKVNKTLVLPDATLAPGGFIIIYADGRGTTGPDGAIHAPFKLPKSGGTLTLYDAAQNLIDAAEVPALEADEALCRDDAGEWVIVSAATPGAANDDDAVRETGETAGEVAINEAATRNVSAFPDENGEYHDYVELRNLTGRAINLKDYCLTDNAAKPDKFRFPGVTLPAGGYIALHCSGDTRTSDPNHLHAGFKLQAGETLRLARSDGAVVSTVTLPDLKTGQAWSWVDGSGWTSALPPTPDAANTVEAAIELDERDAYRRQGGVYISEVMAMPETEQADWVELHNPTSADVRLDGCGLSDQPGRPRRYQFPEGTVLPAGERMTVFLVGDGAAPASYLSAPFALSGTGGEAICLADPSGNNIDTLFIPQQYPGVSYGRDAAGATGYFDGGTPLKANGTALHPPAAGVEFSVKGGLFHSGEAFSVALSAAPGSTIYYTLDCSDPDQTKTRYTGTPIDVSGTTILRARAYADGCLPSIMDTQSYLYDVNAASDAPYVVSLVSDPTGLFSDETGIMVPGPNAEEKFPYGDYNRGANFWMDWEREAHVELFTGAGETAVSQECGIKLHGRNTRAYELKCFKVMAKGCYGGDRFRYPIFRERPWDEYEAFILRYSGQDYKAAFMRDVVMTNQAQYTRVMYMESEECICYLNGVYYSAMYIRENISPFSLARREGWAGQEDALDLVKSGYEEKQGSNASYIALKAYLDSHDNATQETYDLIASEVDIDNFIDFITMQVVYGPPDTVNVKRYRNPDADGKWRWVIYDLDRALRGGEESTDGFELMAQGTNAQLFKAFMANPTLRERFLSNLNTALSTYLSSRSLADAANAQLQRILPILPDYLEKMELTEKKYKSAYNNLLSNIRTRPALVLQHCQRYLRLSDDEMRSRFAEAYAAIEAYNG